ncbi:MAG TPA: hypothetical protein VGE52_01680 [Pirellulales bacterium]
MSKHRKKSEKRPAGKVVAPPEPVPAPSVLAEADDGAEPASLFLDEADPPRRRPWLLIVSAVLLTLWNVVLLILALTTAS